MKDYGISDYGAFQTASATTKKMIEIINNMQIILNKCKETVGNGAVFMGNIAENSVSALDSLKTSTQSDVDNYSTMCEFLTAVETSYKNSDYEALERLLSVSTVDQVTIEPTDGTTTTDGTLDVNAVGSQFSVVNTKAKVLDYFHNVITNNKVYQASGAYGDQCLGFACTHAWGLYTNDTSIRANNCRNDCVATSHFKSLKTNSEEEFLNKIYNEVNSGRPVVIQVSGNKKKGTRHYVSVVGFNKNVKSAKDLKSTDLLIIDSYDGKLEKVVPKGDTGSGRYVIKGTDTSNYKRGNKDYNYGYQVLYLR